MFRDLSPCAKVLSIRSAGTRTRDRPKRRSCGRSAAGSASPCQGEGRGFESRRPLGGTSGPVGPLQQFESFGSSEDSAEWPSGLGKGLQSPARGFDSRLRLARLAQRESTSLTRKGSLVQSQYRAPVFPQVRCPVDDLHRRGICYLISKGHQKSTTSGALPRSGSVHAVFPPQVTGRVVIAAVRSSWLRGGLDRA